MAGYSWAREGNYKINDEPVREQYTANIHYHQNLLLLWEKNKDNKQKIRSKAKQSISIIITMTVHEIKQDKVKKILL